MPADFPTLGEIQTFLEEAGALTGGLPSSVSGVAERARLDWQRDTGYTPWIADTDTRYYDPPNTNLLILDGGLLSVDSVFIGEVELAAGSDYWLRPQNAANEGRPFLFIKLASDAWVGDPASVAVTGQWGYAQDVTEDVFDAVLRHAAILCLPTIQQLGGGGAVSKVREDDVDISYVSPTDGGSVAGSAAQWERDYCHMVAKYRRAVL